MGRSPVSTRCSRLEGMSTLEQRPVTLAPEPGAVSRCEFPRVAMFMFRDTDEFQRSPARGSRDPVTTVTQAALVLRSALRLSSQWAPSGGRIKLSDLIRSTHCDV